MHVVDMPSSGKHDFNYFMQLVWYCSFCPIRNQFCVVQLILIFFFFTMFTQCPWLVHACSRYGSGLSFQGIRLLYLCGGYVFRTSVQCSWFVHVVDASCGHGQIHSSIVFQQTMLACWSFCSTNCTYMHILFQHPSIIMIWSWTLLKDYL